MAKMKAVQGARDGAVANHHPDIAASSSHPSVIKRSRCQGSSSDEERLVKQCLNGSQESWAELVSTYRGLVYSIALRYGAKHQDAADIFQAVCLEVFKSLAQVRNAQSLRSWLITVTLRQAYRWKNRLSNDVELDAMDMEIAEGIAVAPETVGQFQQAEAVHKALEQLLPRNAELVRLLFFQQPALPYTEIARRLGLATGSVAFIRARCLSKLRKTLAEIGFRH